MSPRLAIFVSRFNEEVTTGLLRGAKSYLSEHGITVAEEDIVWVPGAFELPLAAQIMARQKRHGGVICLGCVVKGETAHFEFISLGVSLGIMQASLATETPISFGVLTTYNDEQAEARSKDDASNKGREAAAACLEMVQMLEHLRQKRL
jgi:6,7-dimethyl-8-ribityllumazine synthase